jgi:outer membrane protein TolC
MRGVLLPSPGSSAPLIGMLLAGVFVAGALLAGPLPLSAQEGDPVELTLAEALRLAERSNPGYRQVVNDLELNRIDRSDAWLTLLPTPQVTALSSNLSWNLQTLGTDNFGNPIPNPEARMVQSSTSTQRLGMNFQLDLRNVLNLRQQEVQAEVRDFTALAQYRSLRADVTRAFLDAQERQVMLELEEELLQTAERNLELTRSLYRLARRDRMDLLSAELDLADREKQLEVARVEAEDALRVLRNLVGEPGLGPLRIVPEPLDVFDPAGVDGERLVSEALEGSPRVEQSRAQLRSAERGITIQRAQWLPTISLGMSTFRQGFERDGAGVFLNPNPDADWGRNVAIGVSFPDLGQYFNIRNGTDRARVQARNQEAAYRQVQLEVEQEVRGLVADLRQSHRALELQERRAELAEERRGLQFEAYGLGRGSWLELQTASEQAAQARRAAIQAGYAFERARINLERALGRPLSPAELEG